MKAKIFVNLSNIVSVKLSYIVEADTEHAEKVKREKGLNDTKVVHFDNFKKVIEDKRF